MAHFTVPLIAIITFQYSYILQSGLSQYLSILDMRFFSKGFLVVCPEGIGIIMSILIDILRRRIRRDN
jgi:hypothetical protein